MKTLIGAMLVVVLMLGSTASADVILFQEGRDIGTETYTGAYDKLMYEEAPDLARGSATGYWPIYMRAPGADNEITALVQFTGLENYLPTNFLVQSARMGLTVYNTPNGDMEVQVYELLKPWHPILATWAVDGLGNNWASGGAKGDGTDRDGTAMDAAPVLTTDLPETLIWFDLDAAVVQNWIDNPGSNHGTQLSCTSEVSHRQWSFVGTAGGGGTYHLQRPQLEITGIPEPTTIALLGVGLVGLIRRRRR
jgi:hypothetical protein